MKAALNKLKDVLLGTERVVKQSEKAEPTKEMVKNSTTSGTIEREALITSLFVLSVVQQIVNVSLRQKPEAKQGINNGP